MFLSKLVYYVAATMDGYIATQQHKLDWLESFTLGDDATPIVNANTRVSFCFRPSLS